MIFLSLTICPGDWLIFLFQINYTGMWRCSWLSYRYTAWIVLASIRLISRLKSTFVKFDSVHHLLSSESKPWRRLSLTNTPNIISSKKQDWFLFRKKLHLNRVYASTTISQYFLPEATWETYACGRESSFEHREGFQIDSDIPYQWKREQVWP